MSEISVLGKSALAQAINERIDAARDPDSLPGATIVADAATARRDLEAIEALHQRGIILVTALAGSASQLGASLRDPGRLATFDGVVPLGAPGPVAFACHPKASSEVQGGARRLVAALFGSAEEVEGGVGLVVGRTVACLVNEAAALLAEGTAADDLEVAMRLGVRYPRGLLQWGDAIGATEIVACLRALQRERDPERYRPAPLLLRCAQAGLPLLSAGR